MNERETPEQFRARRAEEKKEQALRQRIGIASRMLAKGTVHGSHHADSIREQCAFALRVADILIDEASK